MLKQRRQRMRPDLSGLGASEARINVAADPPARFNLLQTTANLPALSNALWHEIW